VFTGNGTDEVADGLGGNDTMFGNGGSDTLIGNAGDDTLEGGDGDDNLQGGDGVDTASYATASSWVLVQLAVTGSQNTLGAGSDTLSGIENITGSAFNDFLNGDGGANLLNGGAGNDALSGSMGVDTLIGGDGDDTLNGGWQGDTLNGGDGADTASYDGAVAGVVVDLATPAHNTGEAAGDTFVSVENITGSTFADTISGDGGNNVLNGSLGDDTLEGRAGDDVLYGGDGNDTLIARFSQVNIETFDGGDGDDTLLVYGEVDLRFSSIASIERLSVYNPYGFLQYGVAYFGNSGAGLSSDLVVDGVGYQIVVDAGPTRTIDLSHWTFLSPAALVILDGTSGDDILVGSSQNDDLLGGPGADLMVGGSGSDIYTVDDVNDVVSEAGADLGDMVSSTLGSYTLPANVEQLWLAGAAQTGVGNELGNEIIGTSSGNLLQGLAGDDRLVGIGGADTLEGGDGADTLDGGAGADALDGGAGTDTASYAASLAGVTVSLLAGTGSGGDAQGDTLANIENLTGSAYSDALTGDGAGNVLFGGGDDDNLSGGAGNDILIGWVGADTLAGGAGTDTADYSASSAGVTVNLATGVGAGGDAQGDSLVSIESVIGSAYNDVLQGKDGVADVLNGGDGDDRIVSSIGADTLIGGNGTDTLDYSNSFNGVDIRLFQNSAAGGAANGDIISGFENIIGSTKTDTLAGDDGVNWIWGGAGNETITGRDGADHLFGEAGNDTLLGGAGDDVLVGAAGADTYGGGVGADTVDFSASAAAVTVNLATGAGTGGDAQGDVFVSIENVIGSAFNDVIIAKANVWNNVFDGRGGDDTLTGGLGDDAFVFRLGEGSDAITDFSPLAASNNDVIELVGFGAAFDSFAEVMAAASQNGADVVIDFGSGQTLTLQNLTLAALASADFIFG
jgi:Ca2+-binding RTX toxin-like protein